MSGYTGKDFQGDAMRSGMEHAVNPFSTHNNFQGQYKTMKVALQVLNLLTVMLKHQLFQSFSG